MFVSSCSDIAFATFCCLCFLAISFRIFVFFQPFDCCWYQYFVTNSRGFDSLEIFQHFGFQSSKLFLEKSTWEVLEPLTKVQKSCDFDSEMFFAFLKEETRLSSKFGSSHLGFLCLKN